MSLWIALAALAGTMFGSLANVLIYRIPRGESVVFPASHCPACGHDIRWYDNVPLLSWLLLKGRCRVCGAQIPLRYPVVELSVGLGWGFLAWLLPAGPVLISGLVLFYFLLVLSWIDLETGLLPDMLTYPGMLLGLLFSAWQGHLADAVVGAVVGYVFFWIVAKAFLRLTGREGMGHGDFKLLAMLGAFMGWQALPFIVFVSSLAGTVVGGLGLLLTRGQLRSEIPFGPYLAFAGMLWFLTGEDLVAWYATFLHPGA
ncbi:MAG: prepilin peptidase [Zetaproteobacteria bacterium]|nr:MAG: prepilin peptidase [Zetaproteobacteria bacterium]